ncbi:BatA domain-containing protein [Gemmatimonas sp.]|uniref:BatA domain-containing protein n=1 Tax=Gemmatimonas sp. TaxID=1962908 RepID=UPI00286E6E9C|nr:BatA domain-containing protein [Gemmatimonas sp.]
MAFLAPMFLTLATLVGVPLLVHLLRRKVGRTVDFPAVRYLTRMEQEHSRDLKLRHRLLLLLRVLAVLALALAAARPIAKLAGLGHAPVSLAIVLDNSMSTGIIGNERSVFDSLRSDVRGLLSDLSNDDRAWIVTADGRVIGGSAASLMESLNGLAPLGGRGDLAAATRRAVGLARSGNPRAPVVAIVSDGQRNAFATDSVIDAGAVPVVVLAHGTGSVRNRAVLAARAEPARWTPSGTVNFAVSAPDSSEWRVLLDGRTVARGAVASAPVAAPVRLTQRLASNSTGWVRGKVELDADALRADDARWFAVRVAPPPMVAVRSEGGPFLSAALSTLVEEKRLERGAEGAARSVTVSGADAAGVRLPVLLTAPLDPVRIGEANRTLTRLGIPWRFGAIARNLVLARAASSDGAPLDTAAASVSVFEGTPVRLRYPLVYSPGGNNGGAGAGTGAGAPAMPDTLATAGGSAWAVAGEGYVLIGSPLEPDATELPLRAAFVPWVLEALSRRLGEDGRLIEAVPGEHIAGLRGVTGLEGPDGKVVGTNSDRLTVPNVAGVYYLRRQSARIGALVVNPEPEESDVVGMGQGAADSAVAEMRTHIAGRDVTPATSVSAWRTLVFDRAAGHGLLLPLVALALAALLAESWLARH